MGWIRPYTDRLTKIWSGPDNAYFFDDLGFLGQFFRQGILGVLVYIIMLIRMIYIIHQLRYEYNYKILLIGIFTYICATMPSLIVLMDLEFGGSFYIAIFEYIYKNIHIIL